MAMPGPFQQFDRYPQPGMRSNAGPPMPNAVRNATYAMFAGAALAVVSAGVTISADGSQNVAYAHIAGTFGAFGGLVYVGLWVWMAMANRAGHNWARITATVFFGISCVSTLLSVVLLSFIGDIQNHLDQVNQADGLPATQLTGYSGVTVALALASWIVGLYATVMMWRKANTPFYKPQLNYPAPGWPVPGAPYGYPNPYQPFPGQAFPGQAAPSDQVVMPPVQPSDPWQTPQG